MEYKEFVGKFIEIVEPRHYFDLKPGQICFVIDAYVDRDVFTLILKGYEKYPWHCDRTAFKILPGARIVITNPRSSYVGKEFTVTEAKRSSYNDIWEISVKDNLGFHKYHSTTDAFEIVQGTGYEFGFNRTMDLVKENVGTYTPTVEDRITTSLQATLPKELQMFMLHCSIPESMIPIAMEAQRKYTVGTLYKPIDQKGEQAFDGVSKISGQYPLRWWSWAPDTLGFNNQESVGFLYSRGKWAPIVGKETSYQVIPENAIKPVKTVSVSKEEQQAWSEAAERAIAIDQIDMSNIKTVNRDVDMQQILRQVQKIYGKPGTRWVPLNLEGIPITQEVNTTPKGGVVFQRLGDRRIGSMILRGYAYVKGIWAKIIQEEKSNPSVDISSSVDTAIPDLPELIKPARTKLYTPKHFDPMVKGQILHKPTRYYF